MEKKTKQLVTLVLALSIIFSMIVPATASESQDVQPHLIGVTGFTAQLQISSSGKATCGSVLYNNGDYDVTVILILTQDGTAIKSWTVPAQVRGNQIERYYYVTSGHDYQVTVKVEVKSNGSLVRRYQASSNVVHY